MKMDHTTLITNLNSSAEQLRRSSEVKKNTEGYERVEHYVSNVNPRHHANLFEAAQKGRGLNLIHGRTSHKAATRTSRRQKAPEPKPPKLKGFEKLAALVPGLDKGMKSSDLAKIILNYKPPRRSRSRSTLKSRPRYSQTIPGSPSDPHLSHWDRLAASEKTASEVWLTSTITSLRRQHEDKRDRDNFQSTVESQIKRVSRLARRGILRRKRMTVMSERDDEFERTVQLDEVLPHEKYQRERDMEYDRRSSLVPGQGSVGSAGSKGERNHSFTRNVSVLDKGETVRDSTIYE